MGQLRRTNWSVTDKSDIRKEFFTVPEVGKQVF
jgi:hypothetical protein